MGIVGQCSWTEDDDAFGNTCCQVFKGGMQKRIDYVPKMNIPYGNVHKWCPTIFNNFYNIWDNGDLPTLNFWTIIITLFLKKGKIKTSKYFVVSTWFDNVPAGLIPPTVWKAVLLKGGSGYFLPRMQRIAFGFRAVKPSSQTFSRSSSTLLHFEHHYCSINSKW